METLNIRTAVRRFKLSSDEDSPIVSILMNAESIEKYSMAIAKYEELVSPYFDKDVNDIDILKSSDIVLGYSISLLEELIGIRSAKDVVDWISQGNDIDSGTLIILMTPLLQRLISEVVGEFNVAINEN